MMDPGLARHLERKRGMVGRLRGGGRSDAEVLALLLVETYLRPPLQRASELLIWPLLWLFRADRASTLSVGPGQIQLRHWRDAGGWASLAPGPSRIRRVTSWEASYDLAKNLIAGASGRQERAALYHGGAGPDYVGHLEQAEAWLSGLSRDRYDR